MRPRVNLISPDTRGEMTYREELPLYELLLAGLFKLFGESLILARLYSILLMALTTLAIYLIGRSIFSPGVGFASALVFNLFPASAFWGRTILPELMALFLSTLAILLVLFRQSYLSLVGFILLGLAVAIKPYFMVLILPLVYFLITTGRKDKWYVNFFKIIVAVFITVFPYILWQLYWRSQPEDAFLSHSIVSGRGFELLWRNAPPLLFFEKTRWLETLIKERFMKQLTPLGTVLFIGGIFSLLTQDLGVKKFLYLWLGSVLMAFLIMAQGNIEHEYYQLIILPVTSLFIGSLIVLVTVKFIKIISHKRLVNSLISSLGFLSLAFFLIYYLGAVPFYSAKAEYFKPEVKYEQFLPDIKKAQSLIAEDVKVVIIDDVDVYGSPTLLNHINRQGWIAKANLFCAPKNTLLILELYRKVGAKMLIFPLQPYYYTYDPCKRTEILKLLKERQTPVYEGEYLTLFYL